MKAHHAGHGLSGGDVAVGEPLLLLHGEEQRVEAVQVVPVGGRQLAQRVVQLLGPGQPLVARLRDVLPTLDRGDSLHEQSTKARMMTLHLGEVVAVVLTQPAEPLGPGELGAPLGEREQEFTW